MDEKAKGTPRRTQRYSPELMHFLRPVNVRPISAPYLGFLFRPSRRGKKAILHVFKTWQKSKKNVMR